MGDIAHHFRRFFRNHLLFIRECVKGNTSGLANLVFIRGRGCEVGTFDYLMHGFETALTWYNILFAFVGVLIGTAVGVLPGIGPR